MSGTYDPRYSTSYSPPQQVLFLDLQGSCGEVKFVRNMAGGSDRTNDNYSAYTFWDGANVIKTTGPGKFYPVEFPAGQFFGQTFNERKEVLVGSPTAWGYSALNASRWCDPLSDEAIELVASYRPDRISPDAIAAALKAKRERDDEWTKEAQIHVNPLPVDRGVKLSTLRHEFTNYEKLLLERALYHDAYIALRDRVNTLIKEAQQSLPAVNTAQDLIIRRDISYFWDFVWGREVVAAVYFGGEEPPSIRWNKSGYSEEDLLAVAKPVIRAHLEGYCLDFEFIGRQKAIAVLENNNG